MQIEENISNELKLFSNLKMKLDKSLIHRKFQKKAGIIKSANGIINEKISSNFRELVIQ